MNSCCCWLIDLLTIYIWPEQDFPALIMGRYIIKKKNKTKRINKKENYWELP